MLSLNIIISVLVNMGKNRRFGRVLVCHRAGIAQ